MNMKIEFIITQHEFEKLEYKLTSSNGSYHIFSCQEEGLEIELFEGDEEEHSWVSFVNNVSIIADADTESQDLIEGTNYLNIDARPEIIFDRLSYILHY
ncbi:TPA: hypothetical protein ACX6QP_002183 [Photobacterium damselae]